MLENLFITYANHSFRDNPKSLHVVFDKIFSAVLHDFPKTVAKTIIKNIISLSKENHPKIAAKQRTEEDGYLFDVAYEAVYRYRDGYCENECYKELGFRPIEIIKTKYPDIGQLKCCECNQLYGVSLLTKLAQEQTNNYEDMAEFQAGDGYHGGLEDLYLWRAHENIRNGTIINTGELFGLDKSLTLRNLICDDVVAHKVQ